ncbi:2Fe-2S iron-sulfur cluster-binding protein [Rivibacter subsaxonicus]|uniref:Ring-1,2-phenylacetyl-CoA epoxidase subunit PaaE n=1 Tax=Rivibacter subsaxonicus TaxID=457575 RepID=A0A4Q7VPM2_9BURK|nr:2Fe-2S iron-sulfur cluster-binding protein [Rivibacter subsaxonicus]RZT98147.1 ring-1,2-phenylacetyl-CoA epoxidase subunit PaaE [Rivibacter subsaxonicus]
MTELRFHPLRIAEARADTRDALVLGFELPTALRETFLGFRPGQFLTLKATVDGAEQGRNYSICSAPHEGRLQVAIKRVHGGLFSEWAHAHLKAGTSIEVAPPDGRFGVPAPAAPGAARHVLAFAAGSGITPILAIVKHLFASEPGVRVSLVYGNRASSSVMFRDELAGLKDRHLDRFTLLHVLSREPQDIDLLHGRIDRERVLALLRQWLPLADVDAALACGPQPMMEAVRDVLREEGLAPERIRTELFVVAGAPKPRRIDVAQSDEHCEVALVMDGSTRVFSMPRDGSISLLNAALGAGIDVRHSCKSGVCATCRCKLTAGEIDMDAAHALEDYEIARGFRLACQSYPATAAVTVDFDQDQ